MPHALIFILFLLLPTQGMTQQTPPPPRNQTPGAPAIEQIGQILFDTAERQAIEIFYKALPENTAGEIIKDVMNSTLANQSVADTADEDERNAIGKKPKKHKAKNKKKRQNKGNGKGKSKKTPPGLAKRASLPPGLQKQLDKNGTLPKGLAKRELPSELESQLPPEKQGTDRVVAGNDVVLIHKATGVVLDILKDVISK